MRNIHVKRQMIKMRRITTCVRQEKPNVFAVKVSFSCDYLDQTKRPLSLLFCQYSHLIVKIIKKVLVRYKKSIGKMIEMFTEIILSIFLMYI